MRLFWGEVRRFLDRKRRLGKTVPFIGRSLAVWGVIGILAWKVSCCPVRGLQVGPGSTLGSGAVDKPASQTEVFNGRNFEDRGLSSTLSSFGSSLVSTVVTRVVRFVVQSLLGKQWLSEDFAWRRLDDLKTSLFNYYGHRNLFGGLTVEKARNGVGFPSLEGALMSLAFLTFSVFLIDLIQLILSKIRLRSRALASLSAMPAMGRTDPPEDMTGPEVRFLGRGNITRPLATDTLTTLSSRVFSAIEKPWSLE